MAKIHKGRERDEETEQRETEKDKLIDRHRDRNRDRKPEEEANVGEKIRDDTFETFENDETSHYGTKPGQFEASDISLSHELRSE